MMSSHVTFLISMPQLRYVHIPFDNDVDELNIKREDLVRQIKFARYFRRFTRVLVFVNSHSNEQGLIYHSSDGATDFDEVSYSIVSYFNDYSNTLHSFSIGYSLRS